MILDLLGEMIIHASRVFLKNSIFANMKLTKRELSLFQFWMDLRSDVR